MSEAYLQKIIIEAIPLRSCPVDRANDVVRRAWLLKQIKKYVEKQLEGQFNAKPITPEFPADRDTRFMEIV